MVQTYLRAPVTAMVIVSFGNLKPGDFVPINRVVRSEEGGFIGVRGQEDLLPPMVIDKVSRTEVLRQVVEINRDR